MANNADDKETTMGLRCKVGEKTKWEQDAESRGMALSVHVRDLLNTYQPEKKKSGQGRK